MSGQDKEDKYNSFKILLTILVAIVIVFIVGGASMCSSPSNYDYDTTSKQTSQNSSTKTEQPKKQLTRAEKCKNALLQCVYKNKSKKAMTMSLKDDGFTDTEITNAMNEVKPDFLYAATVRCELLAKNGDKGQKEVEDLLIKEYGFTQKETDWAIEHAKVLWNEDAKTVAERVLEKTGKSKIAIALLLESSYGFSQEEAVKAMGKLNVNWKKVALFKAVDLMREDVSVDDLLDELVYTEVFSKDEAIYAVNNCESAYRIFNKAYERAYEKGESKASLAKYLDRFTTASYDEIEYAITHINFLDVAYRYASNQYEKGKSKIKIVDYLRETKGFTEEEINYAIEKL